MANLFERTETIILSAEIKDSDGNYANPTTSTTITIDDPAGAEKVAATAMTQDAQGKYHYDYTPGGTAVVGLYEYRVTATSGSRVTIADGVFYVIVGRTA